MAQWTTEYPTQPGYYWLRNYRINSRSETISRTEPTIAVVAAGIGADFWLWQWPDTLHLYNVLSAEWLGPIQPPEHTERELLSKFLDYIYHLLRDKSACYVAIDSFLQIQLPPEDKLMTPDSYAYCHRCHKSVDPADYGYNPDDIHALIIFYCKSCQPQQDIDVIASVTVPVNSLHVGDIIPLLPAEQPVCARCGRYNCDEEPQQHCRYPIPNAPGFYCPNKPQPNGYCLDHQAYRIGE